MFFFALFNPAHDIPRLPAGGGKRFLATCRIVSSRVSSPTLHSRCRSRKRALHSRVALITAGYRLGAGGRSRCLWEPPAPAGGGSTGYRPLRFVPECPHFIGLGKRFPSRLPTDSFPDRCH